MSYLSQFKRYLYNRQLKQVLRQKKVRQSVSLDQAQRIGFLFDASSSEVDAILKYAEKLEKKGKTIHLLAYLNTKEDIPDHPFPYFHNKHIGFNHIPKTPSVTDFLQLSLDLLVNYFPNDKLPLEYISTCSKAHCRIGPHSEKLHCFDLIINTDNSFNTYMRQIEQILSKMNANAYEPSL